MQTIFPVLKYDDARAAIDFLERAFGFERHAVHDGERGSIAHAELRLGDEYVLLGSSGEGDDRFNQPLELRHLSAGDGPVGLVVAGEESEWRYTPPRFPTWHGPTVGAAFSGATPPPASAPVAARAGPRVRPRPGSA